jgi:hypothetical protein
VLHASNEPVQFTNGLDSLRRTKCALAATLNSSILIPHFFVASRGTDLLVYA